ncbi:hypothetical protein BQ6471_02731 [Vibrio gazogenes]|nr:hypothetical protein BQ6471_02731 [Vibrio gazogenes]
MADAGIAPSVSGATAPELNANAVEASVVIPAIVGHG